MLYRNYPITTDEIDRSDCVVKFLYFLIDMGIESARPEANKMFNRHMSLLLELAGNR